MDNTINVILIHDDNKWTKQFQNFIINFQNIKIVKCVGTCYEAIELFPKIKVDIILLGLEVTNIWDGLNDIVKASLIYDTKIILLDYERKRNLICEMLKKGGIDSIDKTKVKDIPESIINIYRNNIFKKNIYFEEIIKEFIRLKKIERLYLVEKERKKIEDLTSTEIIILQLIERGYSQNAIANQQYVSIRTVKNHVRSILRKMNQKSSKEAAKKAKENGLI